MKNIMMPTPHKIIRVMKETKAEFTFRVECNDKINHGQFYQLSIPKVGEAPISVSAMGDGWIEFYNSKSR
jgi:anaerobic sulfite reductase subunit B